jgi:hypothetical protein
MSKVLESPEVLSAPLLGLESPFPESVWLLFHSASGRYGCYCYNDIHGVACFSSENGAFRFSEMIDLTGMTTLEVSFDEAREIAKNRPMPVTSLILLDDPNHPQIHFVR